MAEKSTCDQLKQRIAFLEHESYQRKRFEAIHTALLAISRAVNTTSGLDDLFRSIHLALSPIIDTTNFYIALYDKLNDSVTFPYIVDTVDECYPPVIHISKTESLTAEIIRTRNPLMVTKSEIINRRNASNLKTPACTPAEVWLGVPLKTQNEIIGVMAVQNYLDPLCYDQTDLNVMVAVADQIAIALIRKQAEESLRTRESYLSAIIENQPGLLWLKDPDGRFLAVNNKFSDSCGLENPELLIGKTDLDVWPQEFAAKYIADDVKVMKSGKPYTVEELISEKGAVKWFETFKAPIFDEQGRIVGTTGYSRDISERKKAEAVLSHQVDFKERIFNSTDAHLAILDDQGIILDVNDAWNLFAQNNGGDVRTCGPGAEYFRICSPSAGCTEAAEIAYEGIRQVQQGLLPRFDIEYPCGSPTEKCWYLMRVLPLKGRPGMVLISHENISKRKQAEEENIKLESQLQQAQKMEAIGQLAGGVAHDFNNMLGVIIGHTEMAMEAIGPSQPLFADLKEILKAAQRSAAITRQLLAFARKQTVLPKVVNLNNIIEGMLNMLRRLIGENIELIWMPGSTLWPVKIDPSQVDQILANLCINARSAITGVGKICVATENSTLDADYSTSHMPTMPGEYLRLTVSDSGCGMDKSTLVHIFEPFFTTKDVGEGTGLGLATVFGIVKQNNGTISVDSEPGKGATFIIYLPRHRGEVNHTPLTNEGKPILRGKETILLVEDEPALLRMTTTMLQFFGYTVLAANTPGEADRLVRNFTGVIHLLITDVIMPEMDGRALAKRLVEMKPRLRCLFISGYTAKIITQHGVLDEGVYFIQKPFSIKELAAKIRETLDSEADKIS